MGPITVEISIPEDLRQRFEARVRAHGGDTGQYVQEVVARDLFAMSDPERQRLIDDAFEHADAKYSEALKHLAG